MKISSFTVDFPVVSKVGFSLLKRPFARRALVELGPNDKGLNLREASKLLTISPELFITKWNFDIIEEKPQIGRYEWTAVEKTTNPKVKEYEPRKSESPESKTEIPDSRIPKLEDLPNKEKNPTPPKEVSKLQGPLNQRTPIKRKLESDILLSPSVTRAKQSKITDFNRQRKRLHSFSKSEESDTEVTPRKKRVLLCDTQ